MKNEKNMQIRSIQTSFKKFSFFTFFEKMKNVEVMIRAKNESNFDFENIPLLCEKCTNWVNTSKFQKIFHSSLFSKK